MKKKRMFWPLLLAAALLFAGCGNDPEPAVHPVAPPITETVSTPTAPSETAPLPPEDAEIGTAEVETIPPALETAPLISESAPPEEPIVPDPPETEPTPTPPPAPASGISEEDIPYLSAYESPLSNYCAALTGQWGENLYFDHEMSSLGAYYYEGDALENVGFTFLDLDDDGSKELIIGAILYADVDPAIFEIWTLMDGAPVKLVEAHTRNWYCFEYLEQEHRYLIQNEASNGSANFATYYYRVKSGALALEEGVVFDATANSDSPWFHTSDLDWNPGNDQEISSDDAQEITDRHQNQVISLSYYPFTLYLN